MIHAFGTDQTGAVIEYSYSAAAGPGSIKAGDIRVLASTTGPALPKAFQDVDATNDGDVIHVFATNGNSELVHIQVGPGALVKGENVTESLFTAPASGVVASGSQVIGYADYQLPYGGRVYPELSSLVDTATHDVYVYGTNGRDLIRFQLPASGKWQVDDLTNNVTGNPNTPFPANRVFGAPAAYIAADGSQHILQIDEAANLIEYYQLGRGTPYNTQNITLGQIQEQQPAITPGPGTTTIPGKKQTQRIGPQATPLLPPPDDPTGLSYFSTGVLQNVHGRASFRFQATRSGTVVISLNAPFGVMELDSFNPRFRRLRAEPQSASDLQRVRPDVLPESGRARCGCGQDLLLPDQGDTARGESDAAPRFRKLRHQGRLSAGCRKLPAHSSPSHPGMCPRRAPGWPGSNITR